MSADSYYDMKRNAPQRVTVPGIYPDMANDTYHAQTEWLSSSALKTYLPEHYKQGGSQEALDFGTLFHTAVLEPDRMSTYAEDHGIAVLDPKAIGIKADGKPADNPTATKAWKDAVAAAVTSGKRVVTQDTWDADLARVQAMREAVMAHDTAAELLSREGRAEESVFAEVDGVPCRARFDKRIPGVILDLKSTSAKPGRESIRRAVIDYGYDLSAAHYLKVAEAAGLDVQGFGLIFCAKADPFYVTVCDLDEAFLERGRALRALAIERHRKTADAYDGASGFLTLSCPPWARLLETAV